MKLKGILISTTSIATITSAMLMGGCSSTDGVTKEELLANITNTEDITSYEAEIKYNFDIYMRETTSTANVSMKMDGDANLAAVKDGDIMVDMTASLELSGTEQNMTSSSYVMKNESEGYDVYTSSSVDGSDTKWAHQTISKEDYESYAESSSNSSFISFDNISDNFTLKGKVTFEGKKCYLLTGNVPISDLSDQLDSLSLTSAAGLDESTLESLTDATVGINLYFDADTKQIYGMKMDMKSLFEKVYSAAVASSTSAQLQTSVNAGEMEIVYKSINEDVTINLPEEAKNSTTETTEATGSNQ